jgi:maltose alpha-D-glucosyltransferase/alpha-amylase
LESVADALRRAMLAFARLEQLDSHTAESVALLARQLLGRKAECLALIESLAVEPVGAIKTRIHGDYHLGQVLVVKDDIVIIDFEGEPARPLSERRAKSTPLRDVASMLRSFAYAVATARRRMAGRLPELRAGLSKELIQFSQIFVEAYMETVKGSPVWIEDVGTRRRLLLLHMLSKAFYEIDYEAGNRPDWIDIPIEGVLGLLDYVSETA